MAFSKQHYEVLADCIAEIEQAFLDKALHVSLHQELMNIVESKIAWELAFNNPAFDSMCFHDRARRLKIKAAEAWAKFNETNHVVKHSPVEGQQELANDTGSQRGRSKAGRRSSQSPGTKTNRNTAARAKRAEGGRGKGKHAAPYRRAGYRDGNRTNAATTKGDCYGSGNSGC